MSTEKFHPLLSTLADDVLKRVQKESVDLEGVSGPARAAFVADLIKQSRQPLLVVMLEEDDAHELVRDLQFFLGKDEEDVHFLGERRVAPLLPEELSPYQTRRLLPSRQREMDTLATLYSLSQPFRPAITITTAWGLMRRYIPKRTLLNQTEYLLAGADIDRDEVLRRLVQGGYISTPIVEDAGGFSKRGGIIDAFSPLYRWPLRMEFFGDTLESIRLFNPGNQKSVAELEEAYLIPVRELVLTPEICERGRNQLTSLAREHGLFDRHMQTMLQNLDEGLYDSELDPFLPLFYEELAPLFAYLSSNTRILLDNPGGLQRLFDNRLERLLVQQEERKHDEDLTLPVENYIQTGHEIEQRFQHSHQIRSHHLRVGDSQPDTAFKFRWDDHEPLKQELLQRRGRVEILEPLIKQMRDWIATGYFVTLVAGSSTRAERLTEMFEPYGLKAAFWPGSFPALWAKTGDYRPDQFHIVVGTLKTGQVWPGSKLVLISEEEIFGERKRRKRVKTLDFDKDAFLTSLDEISEGDFIVHIEYGIGVYRGLEHLTAGGIGNDYLFIEYLGGDKLYLPVTKLDKIQKFSGADGKVPQLDRMGGTRWERMKTKVKASIREMAEELLKLYAKREVAVGFSFSAPDNYFREFEATFPFEETPDQERAIKDVLRDMTKPKPMDRLVCGDVGFGKTEVAIRAAFKAVLDRKQVAILVPTTVLALQHGETMIERFKNYPVTIETISRFRTTKEQNEIIKRVKQGKVDIVVGTHRLLSKDVEFPNLGLLIIDEEQRFGVAHKERLKKFRTEVDVLTLTATPIPRTLNMVFSGVRDVSVIQTPPADRLSIRTFVSKFDEEVIRDAINTELSRGGQVYLVHNRVQSIESVALMVKRLVPTATVRIAHGQMSEGQLEKVMLEFVQRKCNVLVTTTIIESGIDIPSVNTMIVNRADTFGLAQLYQLRGRVGRGRERAYAYLLVPSPSNLTRDAQKRLAALIRFTELGSGFRIASHDLEIRGAGNILGKQQSGHIATVGIDLYMQLIEEAVMELRGKEVHPEIEPQINCAQPAYLPDSYVPDATQRLQLYKRLSGCREQETVETLEEEMVDRFGHAPKPARTLIRLIELKVLLRKLNAAGLDLANDRVSIQLGQHGRVSPDAVVELVMKTKSPYQFTPDNRLVYTFLTHEMEDPIQTAKNLLHKLLDYGTSTGSRLN